MKAWPRLVQIERDLLLAHCAGRGDIQRGCDKRRFPFQLIADGMQADMQDIPLRDDQSAIDPLVDDLVAAEMIKHLAGDRQLRRAFPRIHQVKFC